MNGADGIRWSGATGPRAQARALRELRDGIGDAVGNGRHRPYLVTWRDPAGELRADLIYPSSVVARYEADVNAVGGRITQAFGITPLLETVYFEAVY